MKTRFPRVRRADMENAYAVALAAAKGTFNDNSHAPFPPDYMEAMDDMLRAMLELKRIAGTEGFLE